MKLQYKKIIDLTRVISEDMPVYLGDSKPKISPFSKMPKDTSNILSLKLISHHGTHIDAPYHKINSGKKLDSFKIEKYLLKDACKIKVDMLKRKDMAIKKEDLKPYENIIKKKGALVIQTDYNYKNNRILPYLSRDAARFISEFNLDILGIDSLSIDSLKSREAHPILLKKDILLLEALINLEKTPEEFILLCAPLSIKNSDGAPCRVAALIK